jgi:hypothetical protein
MPDPQIQAFSKFVHPELKLGVVPKSGTPDLKTGPRDAGTVQFDQDISFFCRAEVLLKEA